MSIDRIHHDSLIPASERLSPQTSPGVATGGLLVAIDDRSESRGVLSVAELLARRERANAHLVGTAALSALPETLTIDEREALREHQRARLRDRTKQRLHNTIGRGVYWSTDAALGALPEILADQAGRRRPQLIVLALNQAEESSRHREAEAIMRVANAVDAPVLVVPPHQELLFERVLVATDFSASSTRAARMALSVMAPSGRLEIIHVEPDIDFEARGHAGWRAANAKGVEQLLDDLRRVLDGEGHPGQAERSVVARTLSLRGEAASAILDHAVRHKCDLIALGGRRVPDDASLPLGSVSLSVLLTTHCAVLVAPPGPPPVQVPATDV